MGKRAFSLPLVLKTGHLSDSSIFTRAFDRRSALCRHWVGYPRYKTGQEDI